jgi:predicted metal-binding protein
MQYTLRSSHRCTVPLHLMRALRACAYACSRSIRWQGSGGSHSSYVAVAATALGHASQLVEATFACLSRMFGFLVERGLPPISRNARMHRRLCGEQTLMQQLGAM